MIKTQWSGYRWIKAIWQTYIQHSTQWWNAESFSSKIRSWCFWTVLLKKTLESPLDCKEIQPVHPKGNQSWVFIGRTDAEAEAPILWPSNAKSQLIGKDPDAGKDWGEEEKGVTEDRMVAWHHWLSGHEFEQALGDDEGQGSLACCGPWDCKESDMAEWTTTKIRNQTRMPTLTTVIQHSTGSSSQTSQMRTRNKSHLN